MIWIFGRRSILMYKYGYVVIRSLQWILRHKSIATAEIYTHVDDNQLYAVVNATPLAIMFNMSSMAIKHNVKCFNKILRFNY